MELASRRFQAQACTPSELGYRVALTGPSSRRACTVCPEFEQRMISFSGVREPWAGPAGAVNRVPSVKSSPPRPRVSPRPR